MTRICRAYEIVGKTLLACLLLLLAACSVPPAPTAIPLVTLARTETSAVSIASLGSTRTPTTTQTAEPAPSATPTPYQNMDFSAVEISFGGFLPGWRYFITFKFPEEVRGSYYAVVDQNKTYKCEVRDSSPNRLYCNGPQVVVYNWVQVALYPLEEPVESQPVLTGRFFVPMMD